jgi:hypothetical protein
MTDNKQRHFIPSLPNYWVLELCGPLATGEYKVGRTPIVAWELLPVDEDKPEGARFAVPVTTDWEIPHPERVPVQGPDGAVRIAGEMTYETGNAWFDRAKAEDLQRAKETA